ncbi:hypothetical protein DBV15_05706 [Temnothorax longispinosus]|uniref:Uncharacterized protein n=1 Tax=Temnothorax longispinosus TaxID=300112 RepID=A0A4S2JBY7_9HYME|nr:hypothetical protein DBV15_05706 [Temnothorax longispinosus]
MADLAKMDVKVIKRITGIIRSPEPRRFLHSHFPLSSMGELPICIANSRFRVMAFRGVEKSRAETILRAASEEYTPKSLMEITVVSKWRKDILTVPRELR